MNLIAIQDNVLVNPEKISAIEKVMDTEGRIAINVVVDGRTYTVWRPTNEFFSALNEYGVDLTKQFFAV